MCDHHYHQRMTALARCWGQQVRRSSSQLLRLLRFVQKSTIFNKSLHRESQFEDFNNRLKPQNIEISLKSCCKSGWSRWLKWLTVPATYSRHKLQIPPPDDQPRRTCLECCQISWSSSMQMNSSFGAEHPTNHLEVFPPYSRTSSNAKVHLCYGPRRRPFTSRLAA